MAFVDGSVAGLDRQLATVGHRALGIHGVLGVHDQGVAALLVAQARTKTIADWKIGRMKGARRWFVFAIVSVVALTLIVLGSAIEQAGEEPGPKDRGTPTALVPEVAVLGEDHRDAALVAGGDHLGVAFGAAGLDHRVGAGLDRQLGAVGEGEEGVGGDGGAG